MTWFHTPVLINEVIDFIDLREGASYADLTFGEGGHTEALLKGGASAVWAVDRDLSAIQQYEEKGTFKSDPRLRLIHAKFSDFPQIAENEKFSGILLDLGVSTRQLTSEERGLTFQRPGPLDMRMDQSSGLTLKEWLHAVSEEELAEALRENADLLGSRRLAKKILAAVQTGKVQNTQDLANLFGEKRGRTHPATVPFMALRMAVNRELEEISTTLPKLLDCLHEGGRLVVITFHSTEDRLVKTIFKRLAGRCICRELVCLCSKVKRVKLLTKKPVDPSQEELRTNPRARSAKLRCIEKIS